MQNIDIKTIESCLKFMDREDTNGFWLEWLEEINRDESTFDPQYVIETLTEWCNEVSDFLEPRRKYKYRRPFIQWIERLEALKQQ